MKDNKTNPKIDKFMRDKFARQSDQIQTVRCTMRKAINDSVALLAKEGLIDDMLTRDSFILTVMSRVICDSYLSITHGDISSLDNFLEEMCHSLRIILLSGLRERELLQ
jgi:hypothetical protein